jgi:AcrR family transcriptional regulator
MSRNESSNSRQPAGRGAQKSKPQRQPDERARRTRDRLGDAFVALIHEKPIDSVTVQDVLDRASVGRSTFYSHFRDKNDLLLSQLEIFLETMSTLLSVRREVSQRVAPVAELFEHIENQKELYRILARAGRLNDFFDLAQGYFSRGIEHRLRESRSAPKIRPRELAARAVALAGSLLSLLRWWLERGAKEPPAEMDELFHRMVWSGLQK